MTNDLGSLQANDLDPIFWPPSRLGVESAWYGHVPFAYWLVSRIRPRILVELGTHNGVSYSAFCEAVARLGLPTSCFAVDTWLGDERSGCCDEQVHEDLVRFNGTRYGSFSVLLRCAFDDALSYFADNSIDLLHIDGFHTGEAGKHDIESWLPKLSDRAVVLLHDTNARGRGFGIWSLFHELKRRHPAFEFLHGHGLGVVAVGTDVPAAVAALCALDGSSINSVRERFATTGARWTHEATQAVTERQIEKLVQTIKAREAEVGSLQAEIVRSGGFKAASEEERAGTFDAGTKSHKAELPSLTTTLSICWKDYDRIYNVWKNYKRANIERRHALKIVGDIYGVGLFFLLYPLYKIVKPFRKLKRSLKRKRIARTPIRTFDASKKTIMIVSHDASQTGAPILAFNLLERFARRYNVISVLLGPGSLVDAFRNVSSLTLGPFPSEMLTHHTHNPVFVVCSKFAPAFAIVNGIASREALIPLSRAGVFSVQLVHEFSSSMWEQHEVHKVVKYADQIVFSTRGVWEEAVAAFPPLAQRPAKIITQGRSRIPHEWLRGETSDNEEERIATVMRPKGEDDDRVVVVGCGTVEVRHGVDLFISVAAALQQRSPSRRFRFVWVGNSNPSGDDYAHLLPTHVCSSGLQEVVTFLGDVNCLDPVFAMADIFLLSSRLDPFPDTAIDAMLAGLPVVCFQNGSGVAEVLSNHADLERLVVPYADAVSAAEVIEQLSKDNSFYQAAKVAARDLALFNFDMDSYATRLEQEAEIASFIKRQEEDDFETISRSDEVIMEYAAPPGFTKSRDHFLKDFVRESAGYDWQRCPFPGFHPGIYRNANPELNNPPFVNPLAHYLRKGKPQGPWLLDIIRPDHSMTDLNPSGPRTALHLHIHYPDLASEILRSLMANRTRPDVIVTVSSDEGLREVTETAAELCVTIKDIMVAPNRGRDIGPLLTLLGQRLIEDYDIVGHLHAKRSAAHLDPVIGELWRTFCLKNLLGGEYPMMDLILDRFARSPKLGLVFPSDPYICGWTFCRPPAKALLKRMGIAADLPEYFFFPMGTMFWARTDAIAPLLGFDLTWNDYPPEPLPLDGTILHAIERLFPVVAQHRGFEIAGTYVPGVTR